jgi:DNA-binding response OmpR family regulator
MTKTHKILIVDDDAELREALVEQLSLHEEFESVAVDNGTKGVQAAKARADRSPPRPSLARVSWSAEVF